VLSLVAIRHAQTVNNHPDMPVISSGSPGPDISTEGVARAEKVALEIRLRFDISAVHASPLRRALQTAEIVAEPLGLTPVIEPALIECNVGNLENKSESADFDTLNSQLRQWRRPEGRSVRLGDDGDSGNDVRDRMLNYLMSLDWSDNTTIVAVSHALALSSLINLCGVGLSGHTGVSERFPENCGWVRIASQGDRFYVADSHSW